METMWAPWRMEYILGDKQDGCVFCDALNKNDDLSLYKGHDTMVIMNKFPYINGHLLVAPIKHLSTLDQQRSCRENPTAGLQLAAVAQGNAARHLRCKGLHRREYVQGA